VDVAGAIRAATEELDATSETPRLDAEHLMAHALGVTRSEMLVRHMDDSAPPEFFDLVDRRLGHEPLAYILGHQDFYGRPFLVTPDVLIPRGDSEVLVERAIAAMPQTQRILDCGTGSGALLVTCLLEMPGAAGIGVDISQAALSVAEANARGHGLSEERARFLRCDWNEPGWSADLGRFDLILANPPYVETGADLAPDVWDFEPSQALFAGPDGLDVYRVLVPQLPTLLAPGGVACVEIGASQADAVTSISRSAGLDAAVHRDLAGRTRVVEMSTSA